MMEEDFSAQIDKAIEAHMSWKNRLLEAVEQRKMDIDVENVAKDNLCVLGIWLHSDSIPASEKGGAHFNEVQTWHSCFHKEADRAIRMIINNDISGALRTLNDAGGAFNQVSTMLIAALKEWKRSYRPPLPSAK